MIVRWSFDENFDSISSSPNFLVGVSEILRAARLGLHLVILDRQLITKLLNLEFGLHDKALLGRLYQEFTQTGRLHEFSTAYLQISNFAAGTINTVGSAVIVPFGMIPISNILEKPVLLVENLENDGWLYVEILKYASQRAGRGHLSVDILHGGGADTPKVLENVLAQKKIICALADSDRDSPSSPKSSTLKKLEKLVDEANWPLARATSPPCRELENVLPLELITQVNSALGNVSNSTLTAIQDHELSIGTTPDDQYWGYFDIKLGQSCDRVSKAHVDAQPWILAKLAHAGSLVKNWTFPGYGESVISQVRASGALVSELRKLMAMPLWRSKFWGFFSFIAWFFVSSPRLVT